MKMRHGEQASARAEARRAEAELRWLAALQDLVGLRRPHRQDIMRATGRPARFGNRQMMGGLPLRVVAGVQAIVVPSAMRRRHFRGAQKLCLQNKIGHQLRGPRAQRLRLPG